jgi:hypothetical protein
MAEALWLAAESLAVVQVGIRVELDERFEADAKSFAVMQQRAMMVGNSPGPRIDVEALVEAAVLRKAASSV